ncbi:MAG: TetR/AcrR family transcriptional regulator C-terminal domain-containing protein [Treponema sp.]|jgi:AcrR family transcriptional regulator|nr:TetR/AcrR family transcriptional regulator C-terminal domain-containing protein [Treponema sp.]
MKNDSLQDSRKTRYTKMVLRNSLTELMKEKSILRISIKDICELADISRSTFYAHYKDQYDLLQHIQEETIANIEKLLEKYNEDDSKSGIIGMLEELLRYIADNGESIQVLLSENGDINFQKKIFGFIRHKQVMKYFTGKFDEKTQEYASIFTVHGSIGLIQQWLKNNMDVPVSEMARLFVKMTQR